LKTLKSEIKLNRFILTFEIECLDNFLNHVLNEAFGELEDINDRNENGEFNDYTQLESLFDFPLKRIELATRTVYNEINIIFENELQRIAYEPWIKSKEYPDPKTINLSNVTLNEIRSLKMINDLHFKQIIKLIEKKYKLKISTLPGAKELFNLRNKVNAIKHRQGYIDFRKQIHSLKSLQKISEKYKLSEEEARSTFASLKKFCYALWELKFKTS